MPDTAVNRRKGTTAQHAASFGVLAETSYDTDKKILVAHDGATLGGFPAAHLHVGNIFSAGQTVNLGADIPALTAQLSGVPKWILYAGGFGTGERLSLTGTVNSGTLNAISSVTGASSAGAFTVSATWNTTAAPTAIDLNVTNTASDVTSKLLNLRVATVSQFAVFSTGNATLLGDFTANKLLLPNTTSALIGGIYFGGSRAFHNFGTSNTFLGVSAGNFTLTTANDNVAVGATALDAITTGDFNNAVGSNALGGNTTGTSNNAHGTSALAVNSTGSSNVAFGTNALAANTTANQNVGIGTGALLANQTGANNMAIGTGTLAANVTGSDSVAIGTSALALTTVSGNIAIGRSALAVNLTGLANTAIGFQALVICTSSENTAIGSLALAAATTGGLNTGIGSGVLAGVNTGANNIGIGYRAGNNLTTGSNNIAIGHDIDIPVITGSNQMTIGNLIYATGVDGTGLTISSGLVGIKVITPVTELHVVSTSAVDPRGIMSAQHSADAIGARFHFRKSRGTATAPTTVVTGDVLGRIRFSGYDSANYLQMGSIDVVSVGTIAATRVPTYMCFHTATDATPSVLTERLRIDQAGKIQILTGVGNDAGGFKHARVTTGSVGAGSTALVTITWTTAFADTNYTVNASVLEATTSSLSMSVVHFESITAAAVTVRVLNNAVGSLTGTVHVIAVHD